MTRGGGGKFSHDLFFDTFLHFVNLDSAIGGGQFTVAVGYRRTLTSMNLRRLNFVLLEGYDFSRLSWGLTQISISGRFTTF